MKNTTSVVIRKLKKYLRLSRFISTNNILSNCQHGFREKTSTSHEWEDGTNYISSCLEGRLLTMGISIDLRKAFNTVDHNILLKKLEFYVTRGVSGDFLKSYISDRSQYVSIIIIQL